MNRRGIKLGLISIAAAMAAGVIFATQALAISGTVGVSSLNLTPGSSGNVTVTATVSGAPGLGAWTVDVIIANPSQVIVDSCTPGSAGSSVCNAHYASNKVRFAGASSSGLTGSTTIGTISLHCASTTGSSALNLDTVGFADATVGAPVEIAASFSPGLVDCRSSAVAAATATPIVAAPPVTGTGASDGGYAAGWLIAGLAALGVAGLAGFGALRTLSTRR